MRFNLTKEEMHDHLKVKKAALISIAINVLEIVAGIVMLTLVRRMLIGGVEESIVRMVSLLCFTIVGWGALTDIGASLTSLRMVRRTQELEEAYSQLEDLNREMRAQRHDFMNHIQVVYSLIEMNEPGEAMTYMDKLYGDMQRVSRMMRTACPAVNALIQAKVVEARQRGAELKLSIAAKWDDPLMPAWAGRGDERPAARGREADGRAGFGRGSAQLVLLRAQQRAGHPGKAARQNLRAGLHHQTDGAGHGSFHCQSDGCGAGRADHGGFPRRGHGVLRLCAAQAIEAGRRRNGAVGRKYRYL